MTREDKSICDDCIYINNGKGSEKCDSCELTGTNKAIYMTDLISREAVLNAMGDTNMDIYTDEVKEIVKSLPPIEQDRPIGHWCVVCRDDDVYDIKGIHTWAINCYCSECNYKHKFIEGHIDYKICPNCGAKMDS